PRAAVLRGCLVARAAAIASSVARCARRIDRHPRSSCARADSSYRCTFATSAAVHGLRAGGAQLLRQFPFGTCSFRHGTHQTTLIRSRGAFLRPGFALFASRTRIEGWRSAERRTDACEASVGPAHNAAGQAPSEAPCVP